jgi:hypothetical protein
MSTRPIRIAINTPIAHDPTSWYRGAGPLAALQKTMNLQFTFFDVNQDPAALWPTLKLCDLVFMQRPCSPAHFNALQKAKDVGIPVYLDMDDDNLSVPKDNPMFHQYNQMPVKDAIVKLARHCDILTVSTEKLKTKYGIYQKNVFVIPNALDDCLLRHRSLPKVRSKMILWRGTPTHKKNLNVIADKLVSLSSKHKDWKWGFLGWDPDFTENMKNTQIMGANGCIETYKALVQLAPKICYYSLTNNDHAQARSHVSWLEYTFGGGMTIAPKHPEFERPGILNFSTPEEFESICDSALKGEIDIQKHVDESWKDIQENYMLSRINDLRRQVITQLCPA